MLMQLLQQQLLLLLQLMLLQLLPVLLQQHLLLLLLLMLAQPCFMELGTEPSLLHASFDDLPGCLEASEPLLS